MFVYFAAFALFLQKVLPTECENHPKAVDVTRFLARHKHAFNSTAAPCGLIFTLLIAI